MIKQTKGPPTKKQILALMDEYIKMEEVSHRHSDGKIYDVQALNDIECLKVAIQIIRSGATPHRRAGDETERSKR